MSLTNISSRLANISAFKFNPAEIQRAAMLTVRQAMEGTVDIVDPTNPFVLSMETTAVNIAAFMQHDEALNRRLYPIAAMTDEDLYYHMSDKDYLNRFAVPSKAIITLLISKEELIREMILDPITGIKKIIIPRNTVFSVADVDFSLQYPIEIRQYQHGGLQAVYDVTKLSPIQTLSDNYISIEELSDPNGLIFVQFNIPTTQFSIDTRYMQVSGVGGFRMSIPITQQYYYARVYLQTNTGWKEIATTHSQQVYDVNVPTVVLKVLSDQLVVDVPLIYINNNLISGKMRVDMYQTRGPIDMLLSNYSPTDFSARWLAIDAAERTAEVSALTNIRTLVIYSSSQTSGGRNALTFEELRQRVINHSVGPQSLPITNVQLQASLQDSGYEVVKNVDTITNRIFLAAKPMPVPQDDRLITAASSSMNTAVLTLAELQSAHGVINHTWGATITPEALYLTNNGVTRLVTEVDYQSFMALSNAQKVEQLLNNEYGYCPFHYVLDVTQDTFTSRAYYLDSPDISSKSFLIENATSGFQVSIDPNYQIVRIDGGYRLIVATRSNAAFRQLSDSQVFAQLSFRSEDRSVTAFMLGEQQLRNAPTDERVYYFDMLTDFAVDGQHSLDQKSFTFSPTDLTTRSALTQDMFLTFSTTASVPASAINTGVNSYLGMFQLPNGTVGLSLESMKIKFGDHLNTLWTQARSIVGSVPYLTYTENIPKFYEKDIFDVDPVTGAWFHVEAGELVYHYLHRAGDQVFFEDGSPDWAHRIGDIVHDAQGNPVPAPGYANEIVRHVDIMLIDGAYRFANDSVAQAYRNYLIGSVVSWLTQDLSSITKQLLDQTKIYFYPRMTRGNIRIMTRDGIESRMEAAQTFTVILHVPASTADNLDLLNSLQRTTIRVIDENIRGVTTAISSIESKLRDQYGNDVIDVEIRGLGGLNNYSTVSVIDSPARLSIRKQLTAQPDGQLIIEEGVNFEIIRHQVDEDLIERED